MSHKLTGLVVLVVGVLFLLRDLGVNYLGDLSGFTILFVLLGLSLLAEHEAGTAPKKKRR